MQALRLDHSARIMHQIRSHMSLFKLNQKTKLIKLKKMKDRIRRHHQRMMILLNSKRKNQIPKMIVNKGHQRLPRKLKLPQKREKSIQWGRMMIVQAQEIKMKIPQRRPKYQKNSQLLTNLHRTQQMILSSSNNRMITKNLLKLIRSRPLSSKTDRRNLSINCLLKRMAPLIQMIQTIVRRVPMGLISSITPI